MGKKVLFFVLIITATLSACGTLDSSSAPTLAQQTPLPPPTETPVLVTPTAPLPTPSATAGLLPVASPKPGTVVLDFVAQACDARWANGVNYLPCPGNLNDLTQGYITTADHAV